MRSLRQALRGTPLSRRFLLIALVALALPLGLTASWLVRDAGEAGEELLRTRMQSALDEIEYDVASRWIHVRSRLMDLADDSLTQAMLADPPSGDPPGAGPELRSRHADLQALLHGLTVRTADGRTVLAVDWHEGPAADPGGIPVTLPVHATGAPSLLGTLEARVRADAVLTGWSQRAARAGGVVGLLDGSGSTSLVPGPMDAALLAHDRFELNGESWITDRRTLGPLDATLVLAAPLDPFALPFRAAAGRGVVLILLVGAAGFALAALLTTLTLRPLDRLVDAAEAVAAGDLDTRLEPEGPEEIARAGRAFNAMTVSLRETVAALAEREALAAVGEFAAGLAHEIRNPLTAMRLDLQRLDEVTHDPERRTALVRRLLSAVYQLDRTAGGVLRLARTGRAEHDEVDLDAVLAAAARTALPTFEGRRVRLHGITDDEGDGRHAPARIGVPGDGAALEQLFLNLFINAGEAVPDGGSVSVAVQADGSSVRVVVRDDGPGFSEAALERALVPLFTTKPRGSGLGLAIAERIARAHRGRLVVGNDAAGGARVEVWLPGSDARHDDGGRA